MDLWLVIYQAEGRETKFNSLLITPILGAVDHMTFEGEEVEEAWEPHTPLYQTSSSLFRSAISSWVMFQANWMLKKSHAESQRLT